MITMITDRIGIGDSSDGKQVEPAVDAVLNVAVDLDIPSTGSTARRHKVGLIDGAGNDDLVLISAVLMLHALNRKHRRVLVHCHEGKSRSVIVVAAYMATISDISFNTAIQDISKARNSDTYDMSLYRQYSNIIPIIKSFIASH